MQARLIPSQPARAVPRRVDGIEFLGPCAQAKGRGQLSDPWPRIWCTSAGGWTDTTQKMHTSEPQPPQPPQKPQPPPPQKPQPQPTTNNQQPTTNNQQPTTNASKTTITRSNQLFDPKEPPFARILHARMAGGAAFYCMRRRRRERPLRHERMTVHSAQRPMMARAGKGHEDKYNAPRRQKPPPPQAFFQLFDEEDAER